ncbi:hypothetical protein CH380_08170 [Leptospira adleri]|uniref:Uncharacterized protein n=1 Tax=Leptospira adleri TaxID=2023186 RepID=A0A2M9YQZ7_9LEPT|nr:hypothetical protein CH380_08170 [Leptospira adleri]PJZ59403.1 hypothetical protein CH376_23915 [Leptospira adleri]
MKMYADVRAGTMGYMQGQFFYFFVLDLKTYNAIYTLNLYNQTAKTYSEAIFLRNLFLYNGIFQGMRGSR